MWAWMKRSDNTDKSELQELRKENRELRLLLSKSLKVSQELSLKQQESLDRVIASKFDLPVIAQGVTEQPGPRYEGPSGYMADVLSIEDDREFLERVHG